MTESSNPFEVCAGASFVADLATVEELARLSASGSIVTGKVSGTYLKILTAHSKVYATSVRVTDELRAVQLAHESLYPAVLRGLNTPDVTENSGMSREERKACALERNRRSNFARTAASTLGTWCKLSVGELADLDAAQVTKSALLQGITTRRAELASHGITETVTVIDAGNEGAIYRQDKLVEKAFARLQRTLRHLPAPLASATANAAAGNLIKEFC